MEFAGIPVAGFLVLLIPLRHFRDGVFPTLRTACQWGGEPAGNLSGPNDVDSDARIFKQVSEGFDEVRFGLIAETGLRESFLANDLTIEATPVDAKNLDVQLFVIPHQPVAQVVYDGSTGEIQLTTNSPLEAF